MTKIWAEADRNELDVLRHVPVQSLDPVRFLVTGNRDVKLAVCAVGDGAVDRSAARPWDSKQLRAALEIVLERRSSSVTGGVDRGE